MRTQITDNDNRLARTETLPDSTIQIAVTAYKQLFKINR